MKKLFISIILGCIIFSCNGQEQNRIKNKNKVTKLNQTQMKNIDINLWKKKSADYMKNLSEEGENVSLEHPYYLYKETVDKKLIEFSGDDNDGYSLKETLPEPNIYNEIKHYRANGSLEYIFKTLIVNPNIVTGEHDEYDEKGKIINRKNYDEGFKSSPEKVIEFIKTNGGDIQNELTIIDRKIENKISIWHVEFLDSKIKKVKILTLEDGTMKILKSDERDSDFLED